MTPPPPIRRVLVANRGEVACRIIRTLRRLGIASVAVHSDADAGSRHVREADVSIRIGPAAASESYLRADRILAAAAEHDVDAIHPGYGFLSESAAFAAAVEAAGIAFCGPTPEQIARFGRKDAARELALAAGVPLLPAGDVVCDVDAAVATAEAVGYPVMLKSTSGGGGIGMSICRDAGELVATFDAVAHVSRSNFGAADLYVERYLEHARHVEVQVVGDGLGRVITLGERDCSLQRRNQKVLEETPAPGLSGDLRTTLIRAATTLCERVSYRSVGTVEFLVDAATQEPYFLEVNTRLQVEHGVTEATHGIDLVEWMVRIAAGEPIPDVPRRAPSGHAIEARIYAEDPVRDYRPSAGTVTHVTFPDSARVDTWLEAGTEVTPHYDPLLAKVIVLGHDRAAAAAALRDALDATRIDGIETNLALLRSAARDDAFVAGSPSTALLASVPMDDAWIEVIDPGLVSTVQDLPGRLGYWAVGVPPSGPMDPLSFRIANRAVGNAETAAAIELTRIGCTLRFGAETTIALGGAVMEADLDGATVPWWEAIRVTAGQVLRIGAVTGPGARTYLAVRGGLDLPEYLGSRSTFAMGGFGGHGGRPLRLGDVLHPSVPGPSDAPAAFARASLPLIDTTWDIEVLYGPHAAPDFLTPEYLETFLTADWRVHHNSDRTGVRLTGPRPVWTRPDGGDAGLHPSNIHDTPYAVGAVDFTGDMPVILGPDGPSLGGFVCPVTVTQSALWKLGQLSPGDRVRFVLVDSDDARVELAEQDDVVAGRVPRAQPRRAQRRPAGRDAVLARVPGRGDHPDAVFRRSGDANILVEYGDPVLDIALRMRVHALMRRLEDGPPPGLIDLTPGIRSLQVHFDPRRTDVDAVVEHLIDADHLLPHTLDMEVESRTVRLPLSWEDPSVLTAVDRYMQSVRPDAPWCPSNTEFIRRVNGLDHVDEVREIVFGASYLVMGLGDVYLGAPVATPLDPRHRLVTTKYNPARTWTPENAVGIGGAYMCVYGMEGPGGYQLVGRTVPIWNTYRPTENFTAGKPWLLRFFDRIEFFPVTAAELTEWRRGVRDGTRPVTIEPGTLRMRDYRAFLDDVMAETVVFRDRQRAAFAEERDRWAAAPEFVAPELTTAHLPDDHPTASHSICATLAANVWKVLVTPGTAVVPGDVVAVLEAMKMEIPVTADIDGVVTAVRCQPGDLVLPGQPLASIDVTTTA